MNLPSFASLRPTSLTAAAIGGVGGQRPPHISIDSNRFSLVDSTGNIKELPPLVAPDGKSAIVAVDVVFIDANPKPSKIFWDPTKPYSPNSSEPPWCFSDNGIGPSSMATKPQNPVCSTCPNNAIGSAVSKFSGANIKACQDFKKLAVIIPGDTDGFIYLMQVKPGSFKNWSAYLNWLKGQKMPTGAAPDLCDVVTRMSFESQGVLKFEPVALVDQAGAVGQQMIEAWGKKVTDEMVGKTDQPIQGMIGQQRPQGQLPPPPIPPQPAPVFVAPPATSEPKKQGRPRKQPAEPAPAPTQAPFMSGLQQVQPTGAPDAMEIPDFLRRQPPAAPPHPPAQAAGIVAHAPDASADLQAKLAAAFNLPVK